MAAKRVTAKIGDIFRINLPGGDCALGQVVAPPLWAFFAPPEPAPMDSTVAGRHLFSVWVMKHSPRTGEWEKLGNAPLPEEVDRNPWFRKQDYFSGEITKYRSFPNGAFTEVPATFDEVQLMETAAVWEPVHLESRLADALAGRENKWEAALRMKPPR